jgi:predicted house-cleaning noncanonical NTP pyrophosphatase (MazG superfamily)
VKLVRDLVHERHRQHVYRTAGDNEIELFLRLKIVEEAGEVASARNPQELMEELADVLEVMGEIARRNGFKLSDIDYLRAAKRLRLGGFQEGSVLVEYIPEKEK